MTQDEKIIREQICDVCHKMWQLGWVAANDGNVSVRLDADTIIATPTGISKSFITPEKLVKLNLKGEILEAEGDYRPSSEIKMHIRCYEEREDVRAVVHAHPPIVTGFALAHIPLDTYSLIESAIVVGAIPITPFGVPSTMEVPDAITPYRLTYISRFRFPLQWLRCSICISCLLYTNYQFSAKKRRQAGRFSDHGISWWIAPA